MSSTKEAGTSQFLPGLLWRSFIEHLSSPSGCCGDRLLSISVHPSVCCGDRLLSLSVHPSVCCGDRLLNISVHPRFVVEIVYWASQFTPRFVVEIVYWASQFTLGLLWRSFIEHLSSPSVCCGGRFSQSLVFCVVFYGPLSVFSLCLTFFYLGLLIVTLVYSYLSINNISWNQLCCSRNKIYRSRSC